MTTCGQTVIVELGRMELVRNQPVVLTSVGLGSCVAMCAYDPVAKVGGMAHMVLPTSGYRGGRKVSPKYVDTGVPLLLEEMTRQGALRSRLVVKVAGGAQMLSLPGLDGRLNIGERNVETVKAALAKESINISGADLGGSCGRTVQLFVDSGRVLVKTVGKESIEL